MILSFKTAFFPCIFSNLVYGLTAFMKPHVIQGMRSPGIPLRFILATCYSPLPMIAVVQA